MIEFRGIWDRFEGVQALNFKGVKGILRGSRGVSSDKTLVAPLEDLYSNMFGSKHYIMVQLANVPKTYRDLRA